MKTYCLRLKIMLLTLVIGLASVPFFNVLCNRWAEIPIKLPQVESETSVVVIPKSQSHLEPIELNQTSDYKEIREEELIQNRDLSLYDKGKSFSNCFADINDCKGKRAKGINFILQHWKSTKRGYIIYRWSGIDAYGETYIFIEPDKSEKWQITLRSTGDTRYFIKVKETIGHSLKYKQATDDNSFKTGTYYLSVGNENGKEIDGF